MRFAPISIVRPRLIRRLPARCTRSARLRRASWPSWPKAQINSLAMKVRFEIAVRAGEKETEWTASGWDTVEYRIATNPGEPLKALDEIASGGEMSRVMLALKVRRGRRRRPSRRRKSATPRTLVFDESTSVSAARGGGRGPEAEGSEQGPAGAVRDASATNCSLRRPAFSHRQTRSRRPHQDAKCACSTTARAPTKWRGC